MKRLGKFLRLAQAERVLLLEATLLLGAIGLGLRLLPFGRLRRLLGRLSRPLHGLRPQARLSAARIRWAVQPVTRAASATACSGPRPSRSTSGSPSRIRRATSPSPPTPASTTVRNCAPCSLLRPP